jgi:hypothetical protein
MGRVMYSVPLVPQCGDVTCWYACMQMMVRFHRQRNPGSSSIGSDIDLQRTTEEVCGRNVDINLGVPGAIESVARMADFRIHRIRSSSAGIESLLSAHGPLFYAGLTAGYRGVSGGAHAVVIRGINNDVIFINDPWPPGVGLQHSMNCDELFTTLQRNPELPLLSLNT